MKRYGNGMENNKIKRLQYRKKVIEMYSRLGIPYLDMTDEELEEEM